MRVRRGPVFITWIGGKPIKVENALLPDGRRVMVESSGLGDRMRYWSEADNAYIEGELVVENRDALFTPLGKFRARFDLPGDGAYAQLSDDIETDEDFVSFLRTSEGARALSVVMTSEDPTHLLTGESVGGFRRSASLVARVRDLGENGYEFRADLHGSPVPVDPEALAYVRRRLIDLGWIPQGCDLV